MSHQKVHHELMGTFRTWLILMLGCLMISCPGAYVNATNKVPVSNADFDEPNTFSESSNHEEESGTDANIEDLYYELRSGLSVPLEAAPMGSYFHALNNISNGQRTKPVRILHYGDSHTAADFITNGIRRNLQKKFGDGGRGFVFLGKPWRSYRPLDVETGVKGEWETHRIMISKDPVKMDGRYGLGGVAVDSIQAGAFVSLTTVPKYGFGKNVSKFEIFYLKQPKGGSFTVYVDDKLDKTIRTSSRRIESGFYKIEMEPGEHRLDVRLKGNGKVRLFGVVVEGDGPGIVYDTLGINGAFFYTSLRWDASLLSEQIKRRNPDLIITMYGANEADSRSLTRANYTQNVKKSLSRFRDGAPNAACLMLGPMDRETKLSNESDKSRLDIIIEVQQDVAEEVDCTFLDLRELMGGVGSNNEWQIRGLAQADGIHLTVPGYRILGDMISKKIIDAYDQFFKEDISANNKPIIKDTLDETSDGSRK